MSSVVVRVNGIFQEISNWRSQRSHKSGSDGRLISVGAQPLLISDSSEQMGDTGTLFFQFSERFFNARLAEGIYR